MARKKQTQVPDSTPHIEGTEETIAQIKGLRERGYEYLGSPSDDIGISFAEIEGVQISQQFGNGACCGTNPMGGPIAERGAETVFSDRDLIQPVSKDKEGNEIGTPDKGYIKYGTMDRMPLDIYRAARALPYTAAGLRFLTDITASLGPALMYPNPDPNASEPLIPYENAGAALRKKIRELRDKIATPSNSPQGGEMVDTGTSGEDATNRKLLNDLLDNEEYATLCNGSIKIIDKKEYRVRKEEPKPAAAWETDGAYDNLGTDQDELDRLIEDYKVWDKTNTEWKEFKKRNNLRRHWQECCLDLHHLDICYPTIGLEQGRPQSWKPKISKVGLIPGVCARFEEMDNTLRINYTYYSEIFRHKSNGNPQPGQVVAFPNLSVWERYDDLQKVVNENQKTRPADRPLWFCCPSYYPSGFTAYYPIPAWWSIFSSLVYKYASTLIFDKAVARQNSTMWGKLIFINMNYLQEYFAQVGAETIEDKRKVRGELVKKINSFLRDRSNNGKTCTLDSFVAQDGKTLINAIEIVDVPVKSSADTKNELEEISSIIFFALGIDPRLIGAVPGKNTSSSGTQSRELYLLKQLQVSPLQQQYEDFWRFVFDWNEWDSKAVMTIRKQVLSTLDRSKTGIVESNS